LHLAVLELLARHPPARPIRLVGLSAHRLGPPPAPALLDPEGERRRRTDRLNAGLDGIRRKHGSGALVRAGLLGLNRPDAADRPAGFEAPQRPGRRSRA
jgi:hypothetical protein